MPKKQKIHLQPKNASGWFPMSFIPRLCVPDKWSRWRCTAEPRGWTSSFSSFSAPFLCRWWWTLGLHLSKAHEEPKKIKNKTISGYCFTGEHALDLNVTMAKHKRNTKADLHKALFVCQWWCDNTAQREKAAASNMHKSCLCLQAVLCFQRANTKKTQYITSCRLEMMEKTDLEKKATWKIIYYNNYMYCFCFIL